MAEYRKLTTEEQVLLRKSTKGMSEADIAKKKELMKIMEEAKNAYFSIPKSQARMNLSMDIRKYMKKQNTKFDDEETRDILRKTMREVPRKIVRNAVELAEAGKGEITKEIVSDAREKALKDAIEKKEGLLLRNIKRAQKKEKKEKIKDQKKQTRIEYKARMQALKEQYQTSKKK